MALFEVNPSHFLHSIFIDDLVVLTLSHLAFQDYFEQWTALNAHVRTVLYTRHFTRDEQNAEFYYRY